MKVGTVMGLGFVALILIGIIVCVTSYISYNNLGVAKEAAIEARYTDNQNVLSNYTTKVQEAAQVTDMARDDLSKVMKDALTARYGADGSKAVFNWIKENYPGQINGKLYEKIQQIIESGRTDFQNSQTQLLDQLRQYEVLRGQVWSGFWLRLAGFPRKDLSKFKIIVTGDVQQKFETGKDGTISLRPKEIGNN